MNRTLTNSLALISTFAGLTAVTPAQAASRTVEFNAGYLASRCNDLGGQLLKADPTFSCVVGNVKVTCSFVRASLASCDWAGIDNQVMVNRLIGQPQAVSLSDSSGAADPGTGKIDEPDRQAPPPSKVFGQP